VKPSNILFDGTNVTLIDFEHAILANEKHGIHDDPSFLGTDRYMAPEALKGFHHFGRDIWCVGVMLMEMASFKLVSS
jgi:serine/threonine protein kinase